MNLKKNIHIRLYLAVLLFIILSCSKVEFNGPEISLNLESGLSSAKGLELMQDHFESTLSFVKRFGQQCWTGQRFFYCIVTDKRFTDGGLPYIKLVIEYLDIGEGPLILAYDSSDPNVLEIPEQPGCWKRVKIQDLSDSGIWFKKQLIIKDALFNGRCNGGDFRIEGDEIVIKSITITAADQASQLKNKKKQQSRKTMAHKIKPFNMTLEDVIKEMKPYDGPVKKGVDTSTVKGKVMCGYQGWFRCPGDGSSRGWVHWNGKFGFKPGSCTIDYWPDMSELTEEEKYETEFKYSDGSTAYVYSSFDKKPVIRHFKWMEEAGIHGVFLQRFHSVTRNTKSIYGDNQVLKNVREGANSHGRSWALMYDFSGAQDDDQRWEHFKADWIRMVDHLKLGRDQQDQAYQRHKGKPLVAFWGLFASREHMPDFFNQVIDFVKNDPQYGGYAVMVGCENNWRTGKGREYDKLRKALKKADIISPWTVGRYNNIEDLVAFIEKMHKPDIAWCRERQTDFLPVIFPGFSWHNMKPQHKLDAIPRLQGRFLWRQVYENTHVGADMLYVAMFDEVDEGTAIFKVDQDPPAGESRFLSYNGLPADHYLWLTGKAQEALSGKFKPGPLPPERQGVRLKSDEELLAGRKQEEDTKIHKRQHILDMFQEEAAEMGAILIYSGSKDKNAWVITSGTWNAVNAYEKWAVPGEGVSLSYCFQVSESGKYKIEIFYGADPNNDHALRAQLLVTSEDGVKELSINQRKNTRSWKAIGSWSLKAKRDYSIEFGGTDVEGNLLSPLFRISRE